ncbi:MAG: ribosomal protein L7/L12 [Anaerolineae bacterium]|jgi:ribosomal protein L7/L12
MATDWNKWIRRALELAGVIERKDTAVRRRLAAVNQSKPRGPVTVVLEEIGPKKISALTAVRKVTNLDLGEAVILAEEMLPFPILSSVDQETAELARDILQAMGAKVRLVGATTPVKTQPQAARPRQEKTETGFEMGIAVPKPALEPAAEEGEYVVVLENATLLPERVAQILSRLTGWSREEADITVAKLPQPILLGVTQETAFKAQRELQMLGAVVDVVLWSEYDDTTS